MKIRAGYGIAMEAELDADLGHCPARTSPAPRTSGTIRHRSVVHDAGPVGPQRFLRQMVLAERTWPPGISSSRAPPRCGL